MKPYRESRLSIVTPVYRNEATIEKLSRQVFEASEGLFASVEHIFVNDASPDRSRLILKRMAEKDSRIKVVSLARNFGQHTALMVGLEQTTGDYILLIDADLEEDPAHIPAFARKLEEGCEIAVGQRVFQKRGLYRRLSSRLFSFVFNSLSDYKFPADSCTMRLMTRRFADYMKAFNERAFIAGFTAWIGLPLAVVPIPWVEQPRVSSYTFKKLVEHARVGLVGFSNKPIRFAFLLGLFITGSAILFSVAMAVIQLTRGGIQVGYTSLVGLISFLMGIQFIFIGLLGEYIGEIFLIVKRRPKYIVYDKFNLSQDAEETESAGKSLRAEA